jgi:protein-disulfide isomerase
MDKPFSYDRVVQAAKASGLDMVRFEKDINSPMSNPLIQEDIETGHSLGITGVPTYFVNGIKLESSRKDDLEHLIATLLGTN